MDKATGIRRSLRNHQPQKSGWDVATADPMDGVRRAAQALRRRWLLAVTAFVSVMVLVLSYQASHTKFYTATSNLVVNTRQVSVEEKDKEVLPDVPTADAAVATEMEIMRSSAVVLSVVHALNLTQSKEFADRLVDVPADRRDTVVAALMANNLKVDRPGSANVVALSYTSSDPFQAKTIADGVAMQYLAVKQQSRRAAVEQVDKGLTSELERLRARLETADAAVAAYRIRNNLLNSQGGTYTEQELSLYKQQEATANAASTAASSRLATARRQARSGNNGGVAAVLQSPVIQQLQAQRALAASTIAEMETRYRSDHPDLIRSREQLAAIDQAIAAETRRQLASLEGEARIASSSAAGAKETVAETSGSLADANRASVELGQLQRSADGLRDTYQTLLSRRNSISSQALVADDDARILSPAPVPLNPSSPSFLLISLFGLILALIVTGASVWIAEAFDRKLISGADVERRLGLPHIAYVPEVGSTGPREERRLTAVEVPIGLPTSPYSESIRGIMLAMMQAHTGGTLTVGITSTVPDEGKSTLAISLARSAAAAGTRTLLIDADFRRPSIGEILGLAPAPGFAEVLRGEASLESAMIFDDISGAMLLPINEGIKRTQDLLTTSAIHSFLKQLDEKFDLVLFDVPPVLAVADARLLLRELDEVLMAVRWNSTSRPLAATALKRMRAIDIEPMGVVMTRVDMRRLAAFGYGETTKSLALYAA